MTALFAEADAIHGLRGTLWLLGAGQIIVLGWAEEVRGFRLPRAIMAWAGSLGAGVGLAFATAALTFGLFRAPILEGYALLALLGAGTMFVVRTVADLTLASAASQGRCRSSPDIRSWRSPLIAGQALFFAHIVLFAVIDTNVGTASIVPVIHATAAVTAGACLMVAGKVRQAVGPPALAT
jgi:hypothetical protein